MKRKGPYDKLPMHFDRPRLNVQSKKTRLAMAQSNSDRVRKTPVTLSKPAWETDVKTK